VAAAVVVGLGGSLQSPLLGAFGLGLSVRLDALSAVMFALVAFVGWVVLEFSRNYLDGDARHGAFLGGLSATLAAVLLLVLSGNLVQLAAAWIATSLGLQRLLVFYAERRRAQIAARKKHLVAQLGNACLVVAVGLLLWTFRTADLGELTQAARALATAGSVPLAVHGACLLLALAALLKSAQFPTHGWLPEVMETPTPVSALLHAGLINAGGFLVIRLADVVLLSAPALWLLAGIGGLTALFGSLVMLTQSNIKGALAYSTVSQMGFMLLECGLGAFSLAVLHIVAHSLYKAHAFLASGSAVEVARALEPETQSASVSALRPRLAALAIGLVGGMAAYLGGASLFGKAWPSGPVPLLFGVLLVLGLCQWLAQAHRTGKPHAALLAQAFAGSLLTAALYFLLKSGADRLLSGALPAASAADTVTLTLGGIAVGAFAALAVVQVLAPALTGSPLGRAAYVHLKHGLYVNHWFDRLVGATRQTFSTHAQLTKEIAQ
jgi:NAD(P)H-quinone oxidoreductase subunit 5